MATQKLNNQMLTRKKLVSKAIAFVISACASFCLFGLLWPLLVKGFESQTRISVSVQSGNDVNQEFQTLLANSLRVVTQDQNLERLVQQVGAQTQLRNQPLIDANAEKIRQAMSVKTVPDDADSIQVKFVFRGLGSQDEKLFLQLFADNLADLLAEKASRSKLADLINIDSVAGNRYRKKLEKLERSLLELDHEINETKNWLIANSSGVVQYNPFRSASHTKATEKLAGANSPELDSLFRNLEKFDFSEIQAQLDDLKSNLRNAGNPSYYGPVHADAVTVFPINGTPHPKQLVLLIVIACACGLFIAIHFDPFADRGFGSLSQMATALRVPIVATIPINQVTKAEALSAGVDYRKIPWVNYLVQLASIFLSCFIAIIFGFCLLNQEIRDSFVENPFHGMTHLVWYLLGH